MNTQTQGQSSVATQKPQRTLIDNHNQTLVVAQKPVQALSSVCTH